MSQPILNLTDIVQLSLISVISYLQSKCFRFGIGVRITSSNNQRCFMPRAGNYGSIDYSGAPHKTKRRLKKNSNCCNYSSNYEHLEQ